MSDETVITIEGNLTADPETRTIGGGATVANFTIASTARAYDKSQRKWVDGPKLFMRCAAWRDLADHIGSSLAKGMRVIASGRLSQRTYETKDGQTRSVTELTVDDIGPSLRHATATVTRQSRSNGFTPRRDPIPDMPTDSFSRDEQAFEPEF